MEKLDIVVVASRHLVGDKTRYAELSEFVEDGGLTTTYASCKYDGVHGFKSMESFL